MTPCATLLPLRPTTSPHRSCKAAPGAGAISPACPSCPRPRHAGGRDRALRPRCAATAVARPRAVPATRPARMARVAPAARRLVASSLVRRLAAATARGSASICFAKSSPRIPQPSPRCNFCSTLQTMRRRWTLRFPRRRNAHWPSAGKPTARGLAAVAVDPDVGRGSGRARHPRHHVAKPNGSDSLLLALVAEVGGVIDSVEHRRELWRSDPRRGPARRQVVAIAYREATSSRDGAGKSLRLAKIKSQREVGKLELVWA